MKKTLKSTGAKELRKELADCNLFEKSEVKVIIGSSIIKIDSIVIDEGHVSAYGNGNDGGLIITLNQDNFDEYVKIYAKKKLAALIV